MFFKKAKRILAGFCVAAMLFTSVGENVIVASAAESTVVATETVAETEDVSGADAVEAPAEDVSDADVSQGDVSESDVVVTSGDVDEAPVVDSAPVEDVSGDATVQAVSGNGWVLDGGVLTFSASITGPSDEMFLYNEKASNAATLESIRVINFEEGSVAKLIGKKAFYCLPNLQEIDLTNCEGLTEIRESAFQGCVSLSTIKLPEGLQLIEKNTFKGCVSIEEITLQSGLINIGNSAFEGCEKLTQVNVQTNNLTCGTSIFKNCALEEIEFVSNNTVVPGNLFNGATFAETADIVIPYYIQEIGAGAFASCITLPSITFEDTDATPSALASIADGAFKKCILLTDVEFPESVKTIGANAFENCAALTSLDIPNTVTVMGEAAFKNCVALQQVTISNAISSLGASTFEGCIMLKTVEVPAGLTMISDKMFKDCSSMYSATIAATVKSIGENAFEGCLMLPTIEIPESVTSIGSAAFKDCENLDNPTMPTNLTIYDDKLFMGCNSLHVISTKAQAGSYSRGLVIPEAVTKIGAQAFDNCDGIQNLTITKNVATIETAAFNSCEGINTVTIEPLTMSCGVGVFQNCLLVNVVFPEGITAIPANLFSNGGFRTNVTVTIPNTVTSIGKKAFGGTASLPTTVTAIVFEEGSKLDFIGESAFEYCTAIESFTIPETVTTIGKKALFGCKKLKAITIPENVTSIGMSAFSGCEVLTTVNFNAIDCTITKTSDKMGIFEDCNIHTILIGDKVKTLPAYMFRGAKFSTNQSTNEAVLITLDIPASVEEIGEYAFANIVNLVGLNFEEGSALKTVGTSAFNSCTALAECQLPNSVTYIGNNAFGECTSLEAMELPTSLEYLGSSAFKNCNLITYYVIPVNTAGILDSAFYGNTAMETVVFSGQSITEIGASAFYECTSLTEIDIPQGTTSIGAYAFMNDESLEKVRIPASVTAIGTDAFKNCPNAQFYVVTGSYAEKWLKDNGFEDQINTMFSINYELDGGTNNPANPGGYKEGESVTLYPASKPGYDFAGWYQDAGLTIPIEVIEDRTGDITVYAKWTLATYTIEYVMNGGENPASNPTTYTINDEYTLEKATKAGHDFKGWFKSYDAEKDTYSDQLKNSKITVGSYGDLTLYAKFTVKTPKVTFNPGKGTVSEKSRTVTYGDVYGKNSKGVEMALPVPTRSGYLFDGWYTADNKLITEDSIVENEENHTLTARWSLDVKVAAPVANYASGSQVFKGTKIMLSTDTPGALIHYTVDGTKPTMNSPVYVDAIVINKPTTIRAIAEKVGYKNSDVVDFTYTVVDEATYWGDLTEEDQALFKDGTEVPEGLWVAGVKDSPYTGKAITFDLRVYDHKTLLTEKKDYTVKYSNNKVAATADAKKAPTVTITAKGNYKGKAIKKFTINPISIASSDFVAEDMYVAVGRKAVKPVPVVTYGKTKLKVKKDFTVAYKDQSGNTVDGFASAGNYKIVITGTGNYCKTKTINCVVTEANLMSKVKVSGVKNVAYTGSAITQDAMVVKFGKTELTKDTDYTVRYEDNTEVGTATIILTGKGNYVGVKKVTFKITPKATINKAKINFNKKSVTYTGSEIVLKQGSDPLKISEISYKGIDLVEGKDYVIDGYEKNTDVGTAKVIIRGIGEYSGTVKKTFKITAAEISAATMKFVDAEGNKVDQLTCAYEKGGSKPTVYLTFAGEELVLGKDYTVSYKNNAKTGTATVTVKGKKNFKGTKTPTFKIDKQDLGNVAMTVADVAYQEKGGIYASKPVLTDVNGKKLAAGTDYNKEVTYTYAYDTTVKVGKKEVFRGEGTKVAAEDIIPANTILKATVKGAGNYEKTNEALFRIVPASIAKAKVTVDAQIYTGKAVEPGKDQITVKLNGAELNDTDYEIVSYSKNVNKGTATVTLRGAGENYGGTVTAKFKIKEKSFVVDINDWLKLLGF